MCGRFSLTVDPSDLQEAFPEFSIPTQAAPRFNIAPTQPLLAVPNNGTNRADFFTWGLIPSWAKDPSIGSRMINARSETLAEKPSFRSAYKYHRCLILADGFFEWQAQPGTKSKVPHFIRLVSGKPFAFAGLWEHWQSPEGSEILSATIITTAPNELMKTIHDRMPVILPESDYAKWLDPAPQQAADLQGLLVPYPAQAMTAYPISTLVNSPANDRPEVVLPAGFEFWKPLKYSDRFPALASRDFAIFWVGQFVSLIGTWMQNTTQPYLAYRLTGSPFDLGLIGFTATLPTLLLALPGGVLVERLDKRKTVIIMQFIMMFQAFGLAALALTGAIRIWHIILMSFVLGAASAIEITARQAMLIELVGKPALPNAIALQSTIFNTARAIGPSLTAVVLLLVKNGGEGWAFFINGLSFLFVIVGLFFVRTPFALVQPESALENIHLVADFKEGWGYLRGNTLVILIIFLAAWMGFFGFPFTQQIPAIARDVLHRAADTEALIQTRTSTLYLVQGVGALIAALFVSFFSHMRRKGLLMTIGEFVFTIGLVLFSFTRSIPVAFLLTGVLGWSMVSQMMMMNTLIQLDVPDHLRGRVFSIYLWAVQGVAPFGSLFIGWLAQTAGVPRAALVGGCVCLGMVLFTSLRWPMLRKHLA